MATLEIVITAVNKPTPSIKDYEFTFDYRINAEHYLDKARSGVSRRFADFAMLEQDVRTSNPQCFCVSLPSFKGSAYTALPADVVDQKIKDLLQAYLKELVAHPTLYKDVNIQRFLESRGPYTPLSTTNTKGSGMAGFFKNMAKSVNKAKDMDSWYESQRQDLAVLESALDKCYKDADKVARSYKSLFLASQEMAGKWSDSANLEANVHLSSALRKFGGAFDKAGLVHDMQADSCMLHFGEFADCEKRYCSATDETFENRLNALSEYESAGKNTIKRKQAVDKLKASSQIKQDKVDVALRELEEAKTAEEESGEFVKTISTAIKEEEWPLLLQKKNEHVKLALISTARACLALEKQLLFEWEQTAQDVSSVAVSGKTRQLAHNIVAGA